MKRPRPRMATSIRRLADRVREIRWAFEDLENSLFAMATRVGETEQRTDERLKRLETMNPQEIGN